MVTVQLNPKEQQALADLVAKKGMSEEAVLKQAFRFYQSVEILLEQNKITPEQLRSLLGTTPPKGLGILE
jgi:hypothetical protein